MGEGRDRLFVYVLLGTLIWSVFRLGDALETMGDRIGTGSANSGSAARAGLAELADAVHLGSGAEIRFAPPGAYSATYAEMFWVIDRDTRNLFLYGVTPLDEQGRVQIVQVVGARFPWEK